MVNMAPMTNVDLEVFKKGVAVEVQINEPGFRGSLFSATILRTISTRTRKIYLEYHTIKAQGCKVKLLRESVDFTQIRPVPPRESTRRKFLVSEEVDVFEDGGWWEGVIISVHDGDVYSVFFRSTRRQSEFCRVDMRLHREWSQGVWTPSYDEFNDDDDDDDDGDDDDDNDDGGGDGDEDENENEEEDENGQKKPRLS